MGLEVLGELVIGVLGELTIGEDVPTSGELGIGDVRLDGIGDVELDGIGDVGLEDIGQLLYPNSYRYVFILVASFE